ncbi:DUF6233 domain-containing protein [Streptomyces vinaceus]
MPEYTARVAVTLPDGQQLRARVYERRHVAGGWQYRVGITSWASTGNGRCAEPVEHSVWLNARHVRPLPGADYSRVPTRTTPANGQQAWTLQDLPHRPGYPGSRLIHVIGCHPGAPLALDEALEALRQPRTVPCYACRAATSFPAAPA